MFIVSTVCKPLSCLSKQRMGCVKPLSVNTENGIEPEPQKFVSNVREVRPSVSPSVRQSVSPSVRQSVSPSVRQSVSPSVRQFKLDGELLCSSKITSALVFGLWSLVFGLWSLVFGLWSLVLGPLSDLFVAAK